MVISYIVWLWILISRMIDRNIVTILLEFMMIKFYIILCWQFQWNFNRHIKHYPPGTKILHISFDGSISGGSPAVCTNILLDTFSIFWGLIFIRQNFSPLTHREWLIHEKLKNNGVHPMWCVKHWLKGDNLR